MGVRQALPGARVKGWSWMPMLVIAALSTGCTDHAAAPKRSLRSILGPDAGAEMAFAKADRPIEFVFPRDHGPHPEFRSEWWYLTAVVATPGGREFGVQFTLFRQGMEPRPGKDTAAIPRGVAAWRTGQGYMGHVAVSDIANRHHAEAERLVRGHPALAGVHAEPFRAYIEGWELKSTTADFWPLRLQVAIRDANIDLMLAGTRPIVAQGDGGLSRKGPRNASYYYSSQRIAAEGRLGIDGATHAVAGRAWLDREWSTSVLAPEYDGWDWFALHLDDGRDLMLARLRRADGRINPYSTGSLADGDSAPKQLTAEDFSLSAMEHWRGWPVAWRMTLGNETPERFVIRAAFEDQVMDTSVRYWEGVVYLHDQRGRRVGSGYMELTGY